MPAQDILDACQHRIGYQFNNLNLLRLALHHASSANHRRDSNERMEFLGDAVLGLVVCTTLYERLPEALEGDMTKIKSAVVSRRTCAQVAREVGLTDGLVVGQGMDHGEHLPSSLAAGTLEAIIAAIYLDGGLEAARQFVLTHMDGAIRQATASQHQFNFKSQLQQWAQREHSATPSYELLDEKGPDHSKCFEVAVTIAGRQFPSAWGPNKKDAEQKAARLALVEVGELPEENWD
ncbi:MAG: ribonuclease III [Phycisphaerales bacterium]|nr:ribonuclease III [Phycisphaerales bacterium]